MIDYDTIRILGDVSVDLRLQHVGQADSYILKEADGITAPEFNIQIKNTLYQGGVFQNRQSLYKQITLNIHLNPNHGAGESVKSLRQNLYKMLSPRWGKAVKVQLLLSGSVVAEIEGHVSGMPMNPFTKEPQVQVIIDCLSACWFAPTPVNYLPPVPGDLNITYPGSAPVGFWMQVTMTQPATHFQVTHVANTFEKVRINYPFQTNDILTIDTRPGHRSVIVTRNAIPTSVLSSLSADSTWISIYEGYNDFGLSTSQHTWNGVTFTPQWWGA